ncbi:PilT/PilU family type 4a pilus ATPase [Candidatus Campbellbacteria bacterium]|nr:MAG: PilT/PilU family type 4a pilus ATPase [Candidatus Campbellbacteria bacterium]
MSSKEYTQELFDLLDITVKEGASDLHLSTGYHPTIRVSGTLIPLVKKEVLQLEDVRGLMETLLTPENKEIFLRNKEIDFSYSFRDGAARFRGNCSFSRGGIDIVLRFIPKKIRTIEELALPTILADFARREQGFFLVVGPVGHGKSTTLAAMIDVINSERADHIVTIEDPIEYIFEPKKSMINQREIHIDTEDFHIALKQMFRQDVDVAMVGEMRGQETIATAVTAAETGHLVLSTLHTNSASQTIDRIIDSFPPEQQGQVRLQLAGSLIGIFSQRLVQRVSGGLVPAYELLINTKATANLIREARTHEIDTVIETGSEYGMIDMNRSLAELVRRGDITVETARIHSLNPAVLERLI